MDTVLRLPVASAILGATAVASLCFAVGVLPHLGGGLRRVAAHLSAMLLGDAVFFAAFAVLLAAGPGTAEADYARSTALVVLPMAGLIATVAAMARLSRPWSGLPWVAGLALAIGGLLAGPHAYPAVGPVPDGYYLLPVRPTALWDLDVLGTGAAGLLVPWIAWRGRRQRELLQVLLVWALCLPLYVNDTLLVGRFDVPYPLTWIAVPAFAVPIWLLLQRHVSDTERRLSRDELTGVASRGCLEAWVKSQVAADPMAACTTVFLDIDGFKAVNDRIGHAAGDELLRAVGATIQAALRPGEVVARVGGDEFVAASLQPDLEPRIARALAAADLPRVSLGVATGPVGAWDRTCIAADLRMYDDKPAALPDTVRA